MNWRNKIRRFSIRGRRYWYATDDGGFSWRRISTDVALRLIDDMGGVVLDDPPTKS